MNYLAAFIDKDSISWAVADAKSALVLEHGVIPIDWSNGQELNSPDQASAQKFDIKKPSIPFNSAIAYLSLDLASNIEIDLPFDDPKKAEKIIPLQLQDRLPFEIENIHFSASQEPTKIKDNYRYIVSYTDKNKFNHLLNFCSANGINFEIVSIESFFLEPLVKALVDASSNDSNPIDPNACLLSIGYLSEDPNPENSTKNAEGIISIQKDGSTLHVRKLTIPTQKNFVQPYLESHINISLASSGLDLNNKDKLKYATFCTDSTNEETRSALTTLTQAKIEQLEPDYAPSVNKIANPKLLFALFSAQSFLFLRQERKENESIQNLRTGQYKFRAPLTELKEAFLDQIAPFGLVAIFGTLTAAFSFLTPIKQNNLIANQINQIASTELEKPLRIGSEFVELENSISDLEQKLGNLSTVSSFSPIDWLYTLSNLIPRDMNVDIESISISTEGMSFRGSVKDYPTSGRLDSLLTNLKNENPTKFCDASLSTEENSVTQGRKPIVVEIKLCD